MKDQKIKLQGDTLKEYESKTQILKAMAHPTRLFILDILINGPLCVCEINELIDADVSTISKHLTVLRQAGLVSSEKKGLMVYYSVLTPCIVQSLSCIESKKQNLN